MLFVLGQPVMLLLLLLSVLLDAVLKALSMLSGETDPLGQIEDGRDANAVWPLSLLALLLLLLLPAAVGLPWWLLLLWLLTTRVRPTAPDPPLLWVVPCLQLPSPVLWLALLPVHCTDRSPPAAPVEGSVTAGGGDASCVRLASEPAGLPEPSSSAGIRLPLL